MYLKDLLCKTLCDYVLKQRNKIMHLDTVSCISLASHLLFKIVAVTGCYENPLINNFLLPISTKFALKLFVCKCVSFQTHLRFSVRFPLSYRFVQNKFLIQCNLLLNTLTAFPPLIKHTTGWVVTWFCLDTLYGCSNTLYGHSDRM